MNSMSILPTRFIIEEEHIPIMLEQSVIVADIVYKDIGLGVEVNEGIPTTFIDDKGDDVQCLENYYCYHSK